MQKPLIISVVGHTNVGKTSLLRTLLQDSHFGEVSPRPSTTRHVEGAQITFDGQVFVRLFDTPGMEDPIGLQEYLENLEKREKTLDGPATMTLFLSGPEATGSFEQEAKVIRQLLSSDAALYVIDAREPVLPKYRDEISILSGCGKPLLPVFNFVAHEAANTAEWRDMLSRIGLHAAIQFDTVSPPSDGEQRLYESLALLVEKASPLLKHLISHLKQRRKIRQEGASQIIADVLIDTAAYGRWITGTTQHKESLEELRQTLRQHERKAIEHILKLYKFDAKDAASTDFPLIEGRFLDDLFSPEALKQMGVRLGLGIATGAAAGVGIDLAVGGMTMGAATTLGAIIGGVSQSLKHYGPQLVGKLKGGFKLSVDDAILRLLALRLLFLVNALEQRGHAAQSELNIETGHQENWRQGALPEPLLKARAHPEWSALNPEYQAAHSGREQEIEALKKTLLLSLRSKQTEHPFI